MSNTLQMAFDFQAVYLGMRLHFNKKYDYSKYGPLRRNQDPDKFEISPDRFIFIWFVKKHKDIETFEEYLKLYGFRTGTIPYLRNFTDQEVNAEFEKVYSKLKHTFDYNFDKMLESINIQDLKTNGTDWPKILDLLYSSEIYPSQFVVLDRTFGLMKKYSKIFADDLLFQSNAEIYSKYEVLTKIKSFDTLKTTIKTHFKLN